ncbi:MAG: shikimate kinase [Clostridia bacterium]|nr:shikimate kinase [Clostridia bacterium]
MGRYGLLGEKVGHSYSPQIHAELADYEYKLYPTPREEVPDFVKNNGLDGFNVTIPYKEVVMPHLDHISDEALRIGSVNTVVRMPNGELHGHNTDYYGFKYMLGDTARLKGKKALVLGGGGASKTVYAVLTDIGCDPVVIISRSGEDNYFNLARHADASVIVNTTPVGMYGNQNNSPIELAMFSHCMLALDLIYNPAKTHFLMQAEKLGIKYRGGLTMLVAQAVRASEIWGCIPENFADIDAITEKVQNSMRSIALIGMPGSGKSSIGRALAEMTGRKFIDLDEVIAEQACMPIPEFFAKYGEPAFRALESKVLAMTARESSAVIATGGGIVTVPGNRYLLDQNCACIFITRPLEKLPSYGRPVTTAKGVEQLWKERKDLYNDWCVKKYSNIGIIETAQAIAADFT